MFVGQIQRYMGHIKNNLAGDKNVKGLIIALEDDRNLQDALTVTSNIKFMKYRIKFDLLFKLLNIRLFIYHNKMK